MRKYSDVPNLIPAIKYIAMNTKLILEILINAGNCLKDLTNLAAVSAVNVGNPNA